MVSKTASITGVVLLVTATPGCSFIFTRGPQASPAVEPGPGTSRPPTPECTSSVAAPVVDTVLSTLSVAVFVTGIAALATPEPSCSQATFGPCFQGFNQGVGWTGIIAGGLASTLFIASAVTGYGRTADCRAAIEAGARPPPPRASFLPSSGPLEGCGPVGDVPRPCSRALQRPAEPPLPIAVVK